MKIRVGMTSNRVSSGFLRYDKKLGFFGGGGVKIKVGGRSRDRTETCIVVLPYWDPEGISSINPWPTNPVADSPCFHVGRDPPTTHFFIYGFILIFVMPKVKTKIRRLEMYI